MKTKNYLILLTETERSMIEESVAEIIKNPFVGTSAWVSIQAREGARKEYEKILETIKSFDGGIRKLMSETHIYFIKEALLWYSNFIPSEDEMNEYNRFAYTVENRNKFQYLMNFDPNNYNPKEKKEIRKKDFSAPRYLLVREVKGKINYLSEIIKKEDESEEQYVERANKKLESQSGNPTGKWMLVKSTEIDNLQLSKDYRYFTSQE